MTLTRFLGCAALIAMALPVGAQKGDADTLFQMAQKKEVVDGDLKGAIQQYGAIASKYAKTDRAAAAKALVRMAECYQKMGDAEACKIFEQVVREYGDQHEVAAEARARLGAGAAGPGIVARQIWTDVTVPFGGEMSLAPNGRTIAMVTPDLDVALKDVSGGGVTALKFNTSQNGGYAEQPALSHDGKQIAFAWFSPEAGNYQVRVAAAEPGAKPRVLVNDPRWGYFFIRGWSRDDRAVLAHMMGSGQQQLAWVSIADGSVRELKTQGGIGFVNVSPDGKHIAYDTQPEMTSVDREIRVIAADGSDDHVLVGGAGNNVGPVWTRDGARIVFASRRSGSYGLWSVPVRDGKAAGAAALVKAEVGMISPLGFTNSDSFLYTLPVGNQDIYAVELTSGGAKAAGSPVRVVDTYVGANRLPAWSPDGKSIAFLSSRTWIATDNSSPGTLVVRTVATGQERVIPGTFHFPRQPIWMPDGQSILLPARNERNYTAFYRVDLKSGESRQVIDTESPTPPFDTLSHDGKTVYQVLFDEQLKKRVLAVYDLSNGIRKNLDLPGTPHGLAASPDGSRIALTAETGSAPKGQCHLFTMKPDGSDVRDLYHFEISGNDRLSSVAWAPDGRAIYFVRGELSASRPHESSVWRIAADGGVPEQVLAAKSIGNIDISPDGRRVVYGGGDLARTEYWELIGLERAWRSSGRQ